MDQERKPVPLAMFKMSRSMPLPKKKRKPKVQKGGEKKRACIGPKTS